MALRGHYKMQKDNKVRLKKKEKIFYSLAFGLLGGACFVFIPMYEIARGLDAAMMEIVSAIAATSAIAGGMASAYAADKEGKKKENDEERGIE